MVELLVRSPSVPTPDDFRISIHPEQTVLHVKQTIEQEHSKKPLAQNMRIVWKGRVLKNEDRIRSVFESDDGHIIRKQTVHFVLSAPAEMPATESKQRSYEASRASALSRSNEELPSSESRPGALVPLGSQFQYVLSDGVPYLLETSINDTSQVFEPDTRSTLSDLRHTIERLQLLHGQLFESIADNGEQRVDDSQYMRLRNALQQIRENTREAAGEEQPQQRQEPGVQLQLGEMIRGFGFGTVWGFFWTLMRMLLLIVVLAHDASMERMLALMLVVVLVVLLRSPWAQQYLNQLQNINADRPQQQQQQGEQQEPGEDQPREYTALEKARALVIALFTSLVPSEPI
ncbi:hypothetical protein EV183_001963 [Coemansia sp. RSA 2336]|nr:hypothetical protein EV183_001963 [Coemansia sp. RSA 2336]